MPRLLLGWQIMRLLGMPGMFRLLEVVRLLDTFRLPDVFRLPEVLKPLRALEYNDLRLYSISLLYGLVYNNLSKQVDDYIILLPRYYINGLMDSNKINKFLKI